MMQNPFQSYQSDPTQGLFATAGNPQMGQPGYPGVPNFVGLNPQQQLQIASLLATQALAAQAAIPQLSGLPNLGPTFQNPYHVASHQNPWTQTGLQNPLLIAALQNPLLNPILAQQFGPGLQQPYSPYQQTSPFGQQQSPFGQQQSPFGQPALPYAQFGSPLAPQTWVGQAGPIGGGQAFGQIHPLLLAQLGARPFHTPGISPWAGY